ncbi:MAG: hypothetical protein ABIA93_00945 [Candidatus Woesearchaeota archaeon]
MPTTHINAEDTAGIMPEDEEERLRKELNAALDRIKAARPDPNEIKELERIKKEQGLEAYHDALWKKVGLG